MKRKVIVLAFILITGISNIFANDLGGVNQRVLTNFQTEFAQATEVRWSVSPQLNKVTFTFNNEILSAYYSHEGERIAILRNIPVAQLPMNLGTGLKKSYSHYWITGLFEIAAQEETAYYITVENADQKIMLRSSGFDSWSVFKKELKD